MLLCADTVVTGREVLRPGWIDIDGGLVTAIGSGPAPRRPDRDLGRVIVVPGFVDTHCHGGGGGSFSVATRDDTTTVIGTHRAHGTTTMIASLVTAAPEELLREVATLRDQVHEGLIAGIHLEGPWLAESRCGAHDPALLRDPDPDELRRLLDTADGTISMVTLAPERAGAIPAIEMLQERNVVAAVGHTDATYQQARAAIAAGATVATHLFNAMRPIHHREPGPIIALMEDSRVTVEMITDGVHVDAALYRHASQSVGPERLSLITDAMSATGMADGSYRLGPLEVAVVGGVAHVAGTDTIAGSTATMDHVFRFAVTHSDLPREAALVQAVRQSSINPAAALGISGIGLIPGGSADAVVLDQDLAVVEVISTRAIPAI
ncbi:N-acetylglucosamine-6-phosphate deacetylase [Gordonia sp. NPDC003424]